jgi:hypothetical protein
VHGGRRWSLSKTAAQTFSCCCCCCCCRVSGFLIHGFMGGFTLRIQHLPTLTSYPSLSQAMPCALRLRLLRSGVMYRIVLLRLYYYPCCAQQLIEHCAALQMRLL